jgi:hypothetical protein
MPPVTRGFDGEGDFSLSWDPDGEDLVEILRCRRGLFRRRSLTTAAAGAGLLAAFALGLLLTGNGAQAVRVLALALVLPAALLADWSRVQAWTLVRLHPDRANEAAVFPAGVRIRSRSREVRLRWSDLGGQRATERQLLLLVRRPRGQVCALPRRGLADPADWPRLERYVSSHLEGAGREV